MSSANPRRRIPIAGSLGRTARLTWLELVKLVGHKLFPFILLLTVVLTVVLGLVGKHFSQGGASVKFSNYSLWVVSSTYALRIAIIVLVAQGAMAMSGEATSRTLNTLLARPIRRLEFAVAKALSLVVATLVVVCAAAAAGYVRGGTVQDSTSGGRVVMDVGGGTGWETAPWWQPSYGDVVDHLYPDTVISPKWEAMQTIVSGFLLLAVPALAAVFLGFLIGTLIDSSGLAVGLSLGVSVTLVLGEFFPGFVEYVGRYGYNYPVPKLATLMLNAGKGSLPVWDEVMPGVGLSCVYIVASLVVSFVVFCRRDVTL